MHLPSLKRPYDGIDKYDKPPKADKLVEVFIHDSGGKHRQKVVCPLTTRLPYLASVALTRSTSHLVQASQPDSWTFDVDVDWSNFDGLWRKPAAAITKATRITDYRVGKSSSILYSYYIEIYANGAASYNFFDKTGDSYWLVVSVTGQPFAHVVRYNSDDPRIVRITGRLGA